MTSARRIAFEILGAVEKGGFASDFLKERTGRLDPRDAGLATQIVLGVLRRRAQLDWLVSRVSNRPPEKMDPSVLRALRMGAFQTRFLTRIPAHAAVAESVDLVKFAGKSSSSGFVNAVLRRLPQLPIAWPSPEVRYSLPAGLWLRWQANYPDKASTIAAACLEEPQTWLRVPPGRAALESEFEGAPPPGSRRMDIGSQQVVPLLDLRPGNLVLDLCAAPGNKTAQALESAVTVIACDSSVRRLASMVVSCPRVQLDAELSLPFGPIFDRILIDAPCSGTGTLARNPEIRWRLTADEIVRQGERQAKILRRALTCLKPGGRLVYSTCSLEPEENEEVVNRVAASRVRSSMKRLPGVDPGDGFYAAVID